jgi:hypothetical protein
VKADFFDTLWEARNPIKAYGPLNC